MYVVQNAELVVVNDDQTYFFLLRSNSEYYLFIRVHWDVFHDPTGKKEIQPNMNALCVFIQWLRYPIARLFFFIVVNSLS